MDMTSSTSYSVAESIIPTETADSLQPTMSVTECVPGQMPDGNGGCSACPSGFYKNLTGNANCVQCPKNTDTNGQSGSTSCSKLCETKFINIVLK